MKPSDWFAGMGSVATSAVPVLANIISTSGKEVTAFSTCCCISFDCSIAVDGIFRAPSAMFFSSRVGMNSWPSVVKTTPPRTNTPRAAPMNGHGLATARSSTGT